MAKKRLSDPFEKMERKAEKCSCPAAEISVNLIVPRAVK